MPSVDHDKAMEPTIDAGPKLGLQKVDKAKVLASLFDEAPPKEQTVGRFRIVARLGRGGMGTVFEGYDPTLDRTVAIKVLHESAGGRHQQRLLREAQALAQLSHPNVVQVFETGEVDTRLFIAMELVRGRTLAQWQERPHPWQGGLDVYLQAGRGLAAAHAVEIVHRDFKPANCIIDDNERVKVLDFGLARGLADVEESDDAARHGPLKPGVTTARQTGTGAAASQGSGRVLSERLTQTGTMLGTPAYMAPEQAQGRVADARADQFSFCVALYEALFGVRPFDGMTGLLELIEGQRPSMRPTGGHASQPTVPAWLRRVLLRGLMPQREDRFASMQALLDAIEGHLRARRLRVGALVVGVGVLATVGTTRALTPTDTAAASCEIDRSILAGAWDDGRRAQVREAALGTGLAFASATHEVVDTHLLRWTERWVDARRRACEATRVEGVASDAQLDRRARCLGEQRRALEGVVEVFAEATPEIVARAPEVLGTLPEISACDDPADRADAMKMPDAPIAAAALEAAQTVLARGRALAAAGLVDDAQRLAMQAEQTAAQHEFLPLQLEARAVGIEARMNAGQRGEGARQLLAVIADAERAQLDSLVARLRVAVAVRMAGAWANPELEAVLVDHAQAWIERTGLAEPARVRDLERARAELEIGAGALDAALTRVEALQARPDRDDTDRYIDGRLAGQILATLGRHEQAKAAFDTAYEIAEQRWGEGSWRAAEVEAELGLLQLDRGDFDAADTMLSAAQEHYSAILGPDSVSVAQVRFRRAKLDLGRGNFERARQELDALAVIFEEKIGPDDSQTSEVYNGLGVVRFFVGDFAGSVSAYQHAIDIATRTGDELSEDTGLLYSNLGESLAAQGEHGAAIEAYRRSFEVLAISVGLDHPLNALPLKGRAKSLLAQGQAAEAIPLLERALALHGDSFAEPFERADVQRSLALALSATGGDATRIAALARDATEIFETMGMSEESASLASLR